MFFDSKTCADFIRNIAARLGYHIDAVAIRRWQKSNANVFLPILFDEYFYDSIVPYAEKTINGRMYFPTAQKTFNNALFWGILQRMTLSNISGPVASLSGDQLKQIIDSRK